mmetsp:Transcript_53720/g.166815  ORF Transcript_53720/g.166815 Transcript_53720/m.166815 type:complete len:204 (-) Transcript_53720:1108-1719(-)
MLPEPRQTRSSARRGASRTSSRTCRCSPRTRWTAALAAPEGGTPRSPRASASSQCASPPPRPASTCWRRISPRSSDTPWATSARAWGGWRLRTSARASRRWRESRGGAGCFAALPRRTGDGTSARPAPAQRPLPTGSAARRCIRRRRGPAPAPCPRPTASAARRWLRRRRPRGAPCPQPCRRTPLCGPSTVWHTSGARRLARV